MTYTCTAIIEYTASGESQVWQASTLDETMLADAIHKIDRMTSKGRGVILSINFTINETYALEV
jgi:hypothetical protein